MNHADALSRNSIEDSQEEILIVNVTAEDWILSAQLKDERCSYLIDVLKRKPANREEQGIHKEYALKNNRLYKVTQTTPVIKFLNEIISMFGVPRRLVCDRGSCYTSEKFTEFCNRLGIKRVLNATATPRANGQVERYNRTIINSITTICEEEGKWDDSISSIQWGLNITVNKSTGKTPYEMLLGFTPRGVNDSFLSNEVCDNSQQKNVAMIRYEASNELKRQQSLQKKYYDSRRKDAPKFTVGQHVLVQRPKGSNDGASRKLLPRYVGPFVIDKVLNHDRYLVKDLRGASRSRRPYSGISSADKMRLYNILADDNSQTDTDSETSSNID